MPPARPAPSPPPQPRGEDWLLCSGLPTSVFRDVSAPALHALTSASLTDPVLQALLQGSSKSQVTLFCRRLGAEFTSSQRDLCNLRVQGSQPGFSLRVERPIFQMKAGAGTSCVCERRGWGGRDWIKSGGWDSFQTSFKTILKIPLIQGLWYVDHWCQSPVYCWPPYL